MDTTDLTWTPINRTVLYQGKIFTLVNSTHTRTQGAPTDFHLLESPDWVNVIAITSNTQGVPCFVLVRQFRPGAQTTALEFPGGLVDPGEGSETAAIRELLEETGYRSHSMALIGQTNPNPAFMTNRMYTYFTDQVTGGFDLNLDHNEVLEPVLVPVEAILSGSVPDFFVNGIMLIALGWYRMHLESQKGNSK
jgi:ADP-ribose pyrophosphatase